jgi:transcription elongation factor Elf1
MPKTTRMHPVHYAKPCPFCGSTNLTIITTGRSMPLSHVHCTACQRSSPKANSKPLAVAMHNAAQPALEVV